MLFASHGRPPSIAEIASDARLPLDQVRTLLLELQMHDLLGMNQAADAIIYAYPFTNQPSEHHVNIYGRTPNALCAIDALGAGGMFRTDAAVTSSCRWCGTTIEIGTAQHVRVLSHARPAGAVVWYDLAYTQTAAMSCCPSIGFFCCDEHLQEWIAAQATPRAGYRLTVDEALEVGRAIFGPVFAAAS
jgi:alkylmercury lyase